MGPVLDQGHAPDGAYRRERRKRAAPLDWRAIESDYRSGTLSLRELAVKHGCSHSTIANFAGNHGWKRVLVRR